MSQLTPKSTNPPNRRRPVENATELRRQLDWCYEVIKCLEYQRTSYRRQCVECSCPGGHQHWSEINRMDVQVEQLYQKPEAKIFLAECGIRGGRIGAGRKRARPLGEDTNHLPEEPGGKTLKATATTPGAPAGIDYEFYKDQYIQAKNQRNTTTPIASATTQPAAAAAAPAAPILILPPTFSIGGQTLVLWTPPPPLQNPQNLQPSTTQPVPTRYNLRSCIKKTTESPKKEGIEVITLEEDEDNSTSDQAAANASTPSKPTTSNSLDSSMTESADESFDLSGLDDFGTAASSPLEEEEGSTSNSVGISSTATSTIPTTSIINIPTTSVTSPRLSTTITLATAEDGQSDQEAVSDNHNSTQYEIVFEETDEEGGGGTSNTDHAESSTTRDDSPYIELDESTMAELLQNGDIEVITEEASDEGHPIAAATQTNSQPSSSIPKSQPSSGPPIATSTPTSKTLPIPAGLNIIEMIKTRLTTHIEPQNEIDRLQYLLSHFIFECNHCCINFNTEKDLSVHRFLVHQMTSYNCTRCDYVSQDVGIFVKHEALHAKAVPYSCQICMEGFQTAQDLTKHTQTKHATYQCYVCHLILQNFSLFRSHMTCFHPAAILRCNDCTYKTYLRGQFTKHKRIHEQYLHCPAEGCNEWFRNEEKLDAHMNRFHREVRAHCCGMEGCEEAFYNVKNLQKHLVKDHGESLFKCTVCPFKTNQQRAFTVHQSCHTDERPFTCTEAGCEQSFRTKALLASHQLHKHSTEKPFSCDVANCEESFKTRRLLVVHQKRFHETKASVEVEEDGEVPVEWPEDMEQILGVNLKAVIGSSSGRSTRTPTNPALQHVRPFKCTAKDCDAFFGKRTDLMRHERKCIHKQRASKRSTSTSTTGTATSTRATAAKKPKNTRKFTKESSQEVITSEDTTAAASIVLTTEEVGEFSGTLRPGELLLRRITNEQPHAYVSFP